MENIIENNKLIAEFMGFTVNFGFNKDGVLFHGEHINLGKLKYHDRWDWLMEVVEKIESLPTMKDNGNFFFEIHQDSVTVFNSTRMDIIIEVIGQESRINNTYQAVIEFIQWYNKQNKNNEKHLHITDRRTK